MAKNDHILNRSAGQSRTWKDHLEKSRGKSGSNLRARNVYNKNFEKLEIMTKYFFLENQLFR